MFWNNCICVPPPLVRSIHEECARHPSVNAAFTQRFEKETEEVPTLMRFDG